MKANVTLTFALFPLCLGLFGCDSAPQEPAGKAVPAPSAAPAARGPTIDIVRAPEGDLPTLVVAERAKAKAEGRVLVVYVGAPWCEPCNRFHAAAEAGRLEGKLPRIRLFELDHDQDEARLKDAGYVSRLIPLFVIPAPDGRASEAHIEGSIKGEASVGEIVPRLAHLIEIAGS